MQNEHAGLGRAEIAVQGFFLRLTYGLAGYGILALFRPDVAQHSAHVLRIATAIYLCICVAGGLHDAAAKGIEDKRVFTKLTRKRVLLNLLSVTLIAYFLVNIRRL